MNSQSHICIATNHPKEDFPPEGIKKLYKMRWSEETETMLPILYFHFL